MASYTYKNLLIIERGSNNNFTINVKKNQEYWFPEKVKPFTYQSQQDKIILIYGIPFGQTDNIKEVDSSTQLNSGKILGVIKILCDGVNIRCISCVGTPNDDIVNILPLFREYIMKTITMCTNIQDEINRLKFNISWDLPKEMENLYSDIVRAGMMSDIYNKSHYFSGKEVLNPSGFESYKLVFSQPTQNQPNSFGQPTQNQPNSFGQPIQNQPNSFGQPTQNQPNSFGQPTPQKPNNFSQPTQNQPNNFSQPTQNQPNSFGQPTPQQPNSFSQPTPQKPNNFSQQSNGFSFGKKW